MVSQMHRCGIRNLSITFVTMQEFKLLNLLFSRVSLQPSGYFIKILTPTCNYCSIECYSPVFTEKVVKNMSIISIATTLSLTKHHIAYQILSWKIIDTILVIQLIIK